jgi:hypothetical protein
MTVCLFCSAIPHDAAGAGAAAEYVASMHNAMHADIPTSTFKLTNIFVRMGHLSVDR